jgi:hypothetical protein
VTLEQKSDVMKIHEDDQTTAVIAPAANLGEFTLHILQEMLIKTKAVLKQVHPLAQKKLHSGKNNGKNPGNLIMKCF